MKRKDQSLAVKYRSFDYDVKAVSDDGLFLAMDQCSASLTVTTRW